MATRYFTFRFGGRHKITGPSGLYYIFEFEAVTPVSNERDAEQFLHQGTPEAGTYLFREVDAVGTPIGVFPPINEALRVASFDPKRFPSDQGIVGAAEWRDLTETNADPWIYYHASRKKLFPGGRRPM